MSPSPTTQFQFNDLVQFAAPGSNSGLSDSARENLQCNILRSVHRIRSVQSFHRFTNRAAFIEWLRTVTPSHSDSHPDPDIPLVNVMFTHAGLSLLGVSDHILQQMDLAFQRGARDLRTLERLLDKPPALWGEHQAPWHAVMLQAYDSPAAATAHETALRKQVTADHEIHIEGGAAFDQQGKELQQPSEPRFGHFGMVDPGRDPVYTQEDYDKLVKQPSGSDWKWDPKHMLSTLLVSDPLTEQSDRFGTYFVYRKYKQDVRRFIERIGEVAKTISSRFTEQENNTSYRTNPANRAVFGRLSKTDFDATTTLVKTLLQDSMSLADVLEQVLDTRAGNAIVESIFGVNPKETWTNSAPTNFNYEDDPTGSKCPFSAHARKANPRGGTGDSRLERRVTVARRSSSYKRGSETGLLFWCAQANIAEQFEYIQEKWANSVDTNPDHQPTPGLDTVTGQPTPEMRARYDRWMDTTEVHSAIWEAVTHTATEYLYAPSLSGLEALRDRSSYLYQQLNNFSSQSGSNSNLVGAP